MKAEEGEKCLLMAFPVKKGDDTRARPSAMVRK